MSDLQNLAQIFNNKLFRVPDYQRGYAWTRRQLDDFWADLERAATGKAHYCGQLTLEKVLTDNLQTWVDEKSLIEDANYEPFFIVDGQQRLTTAIILIQALISDLPPDQNFSGLTVADQRARFLVKGTGMLQHCLFGYARDNPSHEYFRKEILRSPSNEYQGIRTVYTANLGAAYGFFIEKLHDKDPIYREIIFKALTKEFQFNVYQLATDFDVFVAFETMNNRGKQLTRLELLKNRLIYLSTLAPSPATTFDQQKVRSNINAVWKTIYEELGRQQNSPLDDDDFLRAHWILFFGFDKKESDPLTQFLLNRHFTTKNMSEGKLKLEEIQEYIASLQTTVRTWQKMNFPRMHEQELGSEAMRALTRLERLRYDSLMPLILAVLGSDENQAIKLKVLRECERFLLLVRGLCSSRSDLAVPESNALAHDLFRKNIAIDAAEMALRTRVDQHFTVQKVQSHIDDLYIRNGKGYYELPSLNFILFEFEEHLRIRGKSTATKIEWDQFRGDSNSIEHVFPQNASKENWPLFANYSTEHKRCLCHSLGNLVAVTVAKNASLSSGSFESKVRGTDKIAGFSQGSFSELQIAQSAEWTSAEILSRGIELLKFIEDQWNVSLGDDQVKEYLLKLEWLRKESPSGPVGLPGFQQTP